MKTEVRCITIMHKKEEISRYLIFSAFFRLLGIFVYEKVDEKRCEVDTDAVISLLEPDSPRNLDELLEHLNGCFGDSTIFWLKRVAKIYECQNLMRGSYGLQYFSDARDDSLYEDMLSSHNRFNEAYQQFCQLENSVADADNQARKYIVSAEANCMRRMSQIYTILLKAFEKGWYRNHPEKLHKELLKKDYYFHEDIEKKVQKILDIDSGYYGAYAILALADITDDDSKIGAIDSFINAINLIGEKPYASSLWYRMGQYYELILNRPEQKLACYKKAYQLAPNNFRAAIAIGRHVLMEGKYEEVNKWMDRVIEILKNKTDMHSIQPAECHYLYKAHRTKGKILLNTGNYFPCIEEFEKALSIYENDKDEQGAESIYPFLFGDRSSLYKAAARKKLEVWKVYACIAEAAAKSDQYEKYKEFSILEDYWRDYWS